MATFIWCCFEDNPNPQAVAASVARIFDTRPETAIQYVEQSVADWRAKGLLADSPEPRALASLHVSDSPGGLPPIPPDGDGSAWRRHDYQLLDTVIQVRWRDAALDAWVHPVLAHLGA